MGVRCYLRLGSQNSTADKISATPITSVVRTITLMSLGAVMAGPRCGRAGISKILAARTPITKQTPAERALAGVAPFRWRSIPARGLVQDRTALGSVPVGAMLAIRLGIPKSRLGIPKRKSERACVQEMARRPVRRLAMLSAGCPR